MGRPCTGKTHPLFTGELRRILRKVHSPDPRCKSLKAFGSNHFLVHRLDKNTTGLLIVAKSSSVRDELMDLFKRRKIKKSYLALVDGIFREKEGTRESLFVKKGSFHGQTIWGSSPHQGLSAITHFKRLKSGKDASLILCEPVTGRTHQIRVHMAEMGHPILVDPQYAREYRSKLFCSRPLLHAYRLQFEFHGKNIDVTAEIPMDMQGVLVKAALEMRFLGQPFSYESHKKCRNDCNPDEDGKEIEQSSHIFHEPCNKPPRIVSNPHTSIPNTYA